jgi:hypothetical protein
MAANAVQIYAGFFFMGLYSSCDLEIDAFCYISITADRSLLPRAVLEDLDV